MNLTQWYAISVAAVVASLLARYIGFITYILLIARFQYFALKYVVYPLLRYRQYWSRVTRLQGIIIGSYVAINGFCMGMGIKSTSDLIVRSGTMASINLIPLFLGGRANVFVNFLGISLHTYYIAHHWIGRVVIIQSLIHLGLVIASGKPWTFDSFQLSGISAVSALALILISSFYMVRRLWYEFFLKLHFFVAFVAVFALWKHVSPSGLQKSVFPIATLSLWGLSTILRLGRIIYRNTGQRLPFLDQATITHLKRVDQKIVSAIRMTVSLKRPLKNLRPGQYVYLFLSDMGFRRRIQSHPYVITWWDDSMNAKELEFLIQPQSGISSALMARNSVRSVIIDGPYGIDHHMEDYETVILVAKGIGIAGLLPYIRHMTYRRVSTAKQHEAYRRRMITRKLDVYWALDDNCEQDWVSEWLLKLQEKDSQNLFLTVTCFYPDKIQKYSPMPPDKYWRFVYKREPLPIIQELIVKQVQRSAGKTKVAVCGSSDFSRSIRKIVLDVLDQYHDIEFAEVEFRPESVPQVARRSIDSKASNPKRSSMVRLVRRSRLAGGPTSKKSRGNARPAESNKLKKLRSNTTSKLDVIEEKDETSDLEAQSINEKDYDVETESINEKFYEKDETFDVETESVDEKFYEKEIV